MSARSNLSNDSSCSNILSLSRDSTGSQPKLHPVNAYYKKFITRLTSLFKLDTQDLDLLYNKIVECINEGDGLMQSNDADVNELIELAGKLEYNHGLLKNMVEILDQRFLKKNDIQKMREEIVENKRNQKLSTPKVKKQANSISIENSATTKKNGGRIKKQQPEKVSNETSVNNNNGDYSHYFCNTLQKARQQLQKRKQLEMKEQRQKQEQMKKQMQGQSKNKYSKIQGLSNGNAKDILLRIRKQISQIQAEVHKIEENQSEMQMKAPQTEISLTLDNNSQTHQYNNNFFQKTGEDSYYLVDNRYIKNESMAVNVPKLSIKQLYIKQGVDPSDQSNFIDSKTGMGMIRQTSRESGSLADLHPTENSNTCPETNYQSQQSYVKNDVYKNESHELEVQGESERSYNISNVTIIDKLMSPTQRYGKNNMDRNAYASIIGQNFENILEEQTRNFIKKKDVIESVETMAVNNSIYKQNFKENKTKSYFSKLEERNRVLKNHVQQIEKSLSKQKQKHQQINQTKNQGRKPKMQENLELPILSNAVYTQNQVIVPKYIPTQIPQQSEKNTVVNVINQTIISHKPPQKRIQEQNFSYSEVTKGLTIVNKGGSLKQISTKSQKQMQISQAYQIEEKGIRNMVPKLMNLAQNSQNPVSIRLTEEKSSSKESKKMTLGNRLYLANNFSEEHVDTKANTFNGKSSIMKENPYIINYISAEQLYEQSRNVQSKMQLSQDRSTKLRVPGQEIEKIKDRVNEMFKKIKSIKDDGTQSLSNFEIPSVHSIEDPRYDASIDKIESVSDRMQVKMPSKKDAQTRNQLKTPQSRASEGYNDFQNIAFSTGTFKKVQQKSPGSSPQSFQLSPAINPQNNLQVRQNPFHATFADSVIINPGPYNSRNNARFSFGCESPASNYSEQNKNRQSIPPFQSLQRNGGLNLSRQSNPNFSFRSHATNQDGMRNSMAYINSYTSNTIPQRISRAESNSSTGSRNSQRILTISPKNQRMFDKVIVASKPISHSSSIQSQQSRKNVIKSIPIVNFQPISIKNPPPLPPKMLLSHLANQRTLNKTISQPNQIPTNFPQQATIKSIPIPIRVVRSETTKQIRNSSSDKINQKVIPVHKLAPPASFTPKTIENRGLANSFSQAILAHSVVMKYNGISEGDFHQTDFIPPSKASVPVPVIPKPRSTIMQVTSSRKNDNSKLGQNSGLIDRSSVHSSKSKRGGIKVLSKSPQKDNQ